MNIESRESVELLTGRLLILVAHPDDESISSSVLLQRHTDVHVVYVTSGGLIDGNRLNNLGLGDAPAYARLREQEANNALSFVRNSTFHFLRYGDGSVYQYLWDIFIDMEELIKQIQPKAILTHAYEGAHQDHDCCSYLTSQCGARHNIACWEMPFYHLECNKIIRQKFMDGAPSVLKMSPSKDELLIKCRMLLAHASQRGILRHFDPRIPEEFRRQPNYDYTLPAQKGQTRFGVSTIMVQDVLNKFRDFEMKL
jgi:N-acetylglucosamine malate deacetylase 2